MSDLVREESFEVERCTGAGGGDLLLVLRRVAVSLEMLALTVSGGLAKAEELLRHLDLLDVSQAVVPLAVQHHRHGV